MNLLAHAYLSFQEPDILVGNMISDFIKGSAKFQYSAGIQKGIQLHREIDQFTDDHAATKKAKLIFKPYYRLYSGPIMDIIYDHYLANDENLFSEETLKEFSSGVYFTLDKYSKQLPENFLRVFAFMKKDDWLYHYRTVSGIEQSLRGLFRRASFIKDSAEAIFLFQKYYNYLHDCYSEFFPDVSAFVRLKMK